MESEDVQIHEELAQRKTSVFCALILLLLLPSQTHENLRIFSFNMGALNVPCIDIGKMNIEVCYFWACQILGVRSPWCLEILETVIVNVLCFQI